MPDNTLPRAKPGFFRSRYHHGVVGVAADFPAFLIARGSVAVWQRKNPGFRQSPASSRSCPTTRCHAQSRAFFAAGTTTALLAWLRTSQRFSSRVDPSRSGSAKNPGFRLGDSNHAPQPKKPGFGKARLLPGRARQHAATREAGLFSQPVPPRRCWRGCGLPGVSHRAWIRRGLAARRIPAFGLAILTMLRNRKSRASAKQPYSGAGRSRRTKRAAANANATSPSTNSSPL